jgi:branched-chain amino acid transport system permease protein
VAAQVASGRPCARGAAAEAPDKLAASRSPRGTLPLAAALCRMDLATFLVQCLNAVQYGLLLFLVASGLTLIFGIMGVINLAHGSFYMLGAYLAFALAPLFGQNFLLMLAVGLLLSAAFGYLLEWAFYSYLYERDHLQQVLMTYALILVFEEVRSLLVGNDVHGVQAPDWLSGTVPLGDLMTYPVYRLFASAACIVLGVALYLVVNRTRLGMMIRAGASNRDMVRGLGVDIRRLYRIVFAGGVALAALAGMIAAPMSSVYPGMGGHVLIISFVVVVIGGIGSISGALIASLLVGVVDTFGKVFFAELSGIGVYVLMAAILVWRPEGLMKRA